MANLNELIEKLAVPIDALKRELAAIGARNPDLAPAVAVLLAELDAHFDPANIAAQVAATAQELLAVVNAGHGPVVAGDAVELP